MKLDRITIAGVIGARQVDISPRQPITMVCGPNGAGKTSLRDAIALALTADLCRVTLKKEAGALVTDGQTDGTVELIVDGEVFAVTITETGKIIDNQAGRDTPLELPYILDGSRFARASADERRGLLFGITGCAATPDEVKKRLVARGVDETRANGITPYLRAGFPEAQKEAQAKAREAKASWRTVTGETYGDKKGASWKAEGGDVAALKAEAALKADDVAEIDSQLEAANQQLGALQSEANKVKARNAEIESLREKAEKIGRIQRKLDMNRTERYEWEQKVEETKRAAHGIRVGSTACACPECGASLIFAQGRLVPHGDMQGNDDAAVKLPEYEKALSLLTSMVSNGERDIAAALAAKEQLAHLEAEAAAAPSDGALLEAKSNVDELRASRKEAQTKLEAVRHAERKAAEAESKTKAAAQHHANVQAWDKVAEHLAPTGIPAEILADALRPFADRLAMTSKLAGWKLPVIDGDMNITVGGRPYGLLSESEKWRADCLLAEAISHVSGRRLLVLDRMDVLDAPGRNDLIFWLADMADANAFDTALVLGTMRRDQLEKALPGLPDNFGVFWMEGGNLEGMSATAKAAEIAA